MESTVAPGTMPVDTRMHLLRTNEVIYTGISVLAAATTVLAFLRHDIPAAEVGLLILAPTGTIAGITHAAKNYLKRKISATPAQP